MKYKKKTTEQVMEKMYNSYLATLLYDRKIIKPDKNDLINFLYPTKDMLLSPYLLDNIELGADLLLDYLSKDKNILFIVDADLDGFTSSAELWLYIKQQFPNARLQYYLHEGKQHGLEDCWEYILQQNVDLVICPDSSSNDYEYHERIAKQGKKILVLDHHIAEKYSENAIVINNQLSKRYDNKELTGASVVYKFLCVLDEKLGINNADYFLDLASVGAIGDMADVTPLENRYINSVGLKNINNPCLKELIMKQSYSIGSTTEVTPTDVSFYIAPLVNALIRGGSMNEKTILFESFIDGYRKVESTKRGTKGTFESLAEQNARNCVNARARQNREKEKGLEQLKIQIFNEEKDNNKILIADASEIDVSTTLTGLIAMNLAAEYKKPTMLGRLGTDNRFRGSCRGLNESELKDFRQFLLDSNLMEFAEGHPNSFGFEIKKTNIPKLINYANEKLKNVDFNEGYYEVDYILSANSLSIAPIINDLSDFKYLWGKGNTECLMAIENIPVRNYEIIGKNKDTLKFTFNNITYIKFRANEIIDKISQISEPLIINLVGRPNVNEWGGTIKPQIIIEDLEYEPIDDTTF